MRSASTVIFAVFSVGMPADQLSALDHKLSPPLLLNVETITDGDPSCPCPFIAGVEPPSVICASCAFVRPLASDPKEISLSAAPVMVSALPLPQVAPELSAKAIAVTAASTANV